MDSVHTVELDAAAKALTDAMQEATEQTVSIQCNSPQVRSWWNDQLNNTVCRLYHLHDCERLHIAV